MKLKELSLRESEASLNLNFLRLDTEDDFDTIIEVLTKNFKAVSIMRTNGPGVMVWEFFVDDAHLRLYNDDYGNFIRASSDEERSVLRRIYDQWSLYRNPS